MGNLLLDALWGRGRAPVLRTVVVNEVASLTTKQGA